MATITASGINCSNGTLDGYYTGTTTTNTSYPLGSYLLLTGSYTNSPNVNSSAGTVYVYTAGIGGTPKVFGNSAVGTRTAISGTWSSRGGYTIDGCGSVTGALVQRTA